ncbi:MAG: aromatic amino acid transport family protein [Chlamydiales bacterium]
MLHEHKRLLRATLLVAGTTIGGGMLALPVLTSPGGFIPALVMYVLCWAIMVCTGLLALEAYLWMDGDPNLISMAEKTLGRWGKVYTWCLYIFLFYCLTLAYTVGCGKLVVDFLDGSIDHWMGNLIFIGIFFPLVFAGARLIGRLNTPLMAGLIFFYCAFVILGLPYVRVENLTRVDWLQSLKAMPVAFTAFGFHGIIPTLGRYLHKDANHARTAIVIGSLIPLLCYVIWEWLILGIVPTEGPGGLLEAISKDMTAVEPLKAVIQNPLIYTVGQFFAFFALVTSFLGVTLGLRDFLADGLTIEKDVKGRFVICLLIFLPVLLLSFSNPAIFLKALDYGGGLGAALLLGLLPIMMVWSGRYYHKFPQQSVALRGGRAILVILISLITVELVIEAIHLMG